MPNADIDNAAAAAMDGGWSGMRWWWKYTVYCAVTIRDRMSGRPAFRRIYPQPIHAVSFKRARSPARAYATYASARNTSRTGSIIFNSRARIDEYHGRVQGRRDWRRETRESMPNFVSRCAADSAAATKESVFTSKSVSFFFFSFSHGAFIYLKELRLIASANWVLEKPLLFVRKICNWNFLSIFVRIRKNLCTYVMYIRVFKKSNTPYIW